MPHVTLPVPTGSLEGQTIASAVRPVCAIVSPLHLPIIGSGVLPSTTEPGRLNIHCAIARTNRLIRLTRTIIAALDTLGAASLPIPLEDWIPHVTLASGFFGNQPLHQYVSRVSGTMDNLVFLADAIDVSEQDPSGQWVLVRRFPLSGQGSARTPRP